MPVSCPYLILSRNKLNGYSGAINTPILHAVTDNVGAGFEAPRVALGRAGEPAEIAALATFLLNDESRYITGSCYGIDGGWAC